MQKSLQQKWAFVQQVTPDTKDAFEPAEKSFWNSFMPDLFQGIGEGIPGRGVTHLSVKQSGLDLTDPTLMAPENWTVSYVIT